MQKIVIWLAIIATGISGFTQNPLSLNQCYEKAIQNHPYGLQKEELEKINQLSKTNISSSWLPQLAFNAQATYQSEVIEIDIPVPGMDFSGPTRDQYRMSLEAQQLIYDGGLNHKRNEVQQASHKEKLQEVEVKLYQVLEQVNHHFFQHFILEENLNILNLTLAEVDEKLRTIKSAVANGAVLPPAQWALEAEMLRIEQTREALESSRQSNQKILEILVGEDLASQQLQLPASMVPAQNTLNRPETALFALQKERLLATGRLSATAKMPRLSGFAQAGYGKPGLNMLSDQFDFYYIAGIRLNWNLWDWQKTKRERQIQHVKANMVSIQQQEFEQHISIALTAVSSRISQLEKAIKKDLQIIELQAKILESTGSQLEYGVINSTEYLHHVHALAKAKTEYETHKIRILQAVAEHNIITGNR